MTKTTRRAAVLGSPIAHSLSPVLHRAAYARLGLADWTYGRHEVDEAAFPGFLAALERGELGASGESGGSAVGDGDGDGDGAGHDEGTWAGLSLTMPLKRVVIPLLDEVDPTALAVNAVNTLVFRPDGSKYGANTDVTGLAAALRERGVRPGVEGAAVLGAGATAGSALAALSDMVKGPITIYLRNPARLAEFDDLIAHFGLELDPRPWSEAPAAADFELVVNTTPAGAADALAEQLPQRVGTLFDVLYHPWPTPLAAAWSSRGGAVLGGQDLLVHQAVRQVELMTGVEGRGAEILAAMREALREQ